MNQAQQLYTTAAADISGMVSQLQTYADSLHDVSPDGIHFGHVADLERVKKLLSELLTVCILK